MIPNLRFKREDGTDYPDWKTFCIADLGEFFNGLTGKNSSHFGHGSSQYVQYSQVFRNSYIKLHECDNVDVEDSDKQNALKVGDALFTTSSEVADEVAFASILLNKPEVDTYLNSFCFGLRLNSLVAPSFAQYLFRTTIFRKAVYPLAQGSTRYNVSKKEVGKVKLLIPSVKEQNHMAKSFRILDQKINLLTKKKEALETYKKGLMQKIFSKEIRFKREDGTDYPEWGIETLDKLCLKCKSGGTPKSTVAEYYNGNIPFLAISDMTEQGKYLRSTTKSISELGIENSASWIVPKQSLIYSMYASVGFVSINLIPLATSQAVLNLIVDESICLTEYLYYWLYQFQKNVHVYVTTGTQGNLNAQTVKSFKVDLPSVKEQENIILTLSKIDIQISLMHTQIENTATLKKGLLQQMFV